MQGRRKPNPKTPQKELEKARKHYYDKHEEYALHRRIKLGKLRPADKELLEKRKYERNKRLFDEWNEMLAKKIKELDDDELIEGWYLRRALQLQLLQNIEWYERFKTNDKNQQL